MVGRLVQHQEIRWVVQQARHAKTRFLAAGERADRLVHIVARELERTRQRTQRSQALLRKIFLELLDNGQVCIQHIQRLLREVSHDEAGPQPHLSGVWHLHAGDHLQQRRLPRAVTAHHRPALTAPDDEAKAIVDTA